MEWHGNFFRFRQISRRIQSHMATSCSYLGVPFPLKNPDHLCAREYGQFWHSYTVIKCRLTSSFSTEEVFSSSRHRSVASLIFVSASSTVSPWLWQPSRARFVTE